MIELTTQSNKVFLNVNGKRIAETPKNDRNSYSFSIEEPTPTAAIYTCEFGELPSTVERIFFSSFRTELIEHCPSIGREEDPDHYSVTLLSFLELEFWNQIYTPTTFIRDLKSMITRERGIGIVEIEVIQSESYGLRLVFTIDDLKTKIGDSITTIIGFLKEMELQAITESLNEEKGKSLATYFSFPEDVKTSCEQYLLYFGEFLRTVGINAAVEIKEEADRVLFSVTPNDSHEALDRIRQVLDLYLGLPTATFTPTEDREYRLEGQRLTANVMHLKSQLMLAQATLEAKNATIEAQRERLIYQGQLIEGRLLPEPAKPQAKEVEKEEILDGMVEIKKYEGKGFAVNLPKMYRVVRDFLKGVNKD
jgi:hypothetical protein